MDLRFQGISLQRIDRKRQRPLHHAVNEQFMPRRIDVGNSVVVALEVQSRRGDRSLEQLQWRPRDACARAARRDRNDPLHLLLPLRWHAISGKRPPGRLHPLGRVRSDTVIRVRGAHTRDRCPGRQQRTAQQRPPVQQTISRNRLLVQSETVLLNFSHGRPRFLSPTPAKTKLPRCRTAYRGIEAASSLQFAIIRNQEHPRRRSRPTSTPRKSAC